MLLFNHPLDINRELIYGVDIMEYGSISLVDLQGEYIGSVGMEDRMGIGLYGDRMGLCYVVGVACVCRWIGCSLSRTL
jgi:hypothetical protein